MDEYYPEEVAEQVFEPHEDHDLFEREVIGDDDDLLLVHHLLMNESSRKNEP